MTTSTGTRGSTREMTAKGGMLFAGVMLILLGLLQFFEGISALSHDPVLVRTPNYLFQFSTTTWGWIHVFIGLAVAVVGCYVLTAAPWARGIAIGLAALQAFFSFFFLPYYPLWALIIVALDAFVIWALVVAPTREHARGTYQ